MRFGVPVRLARSAPLIEDPRWLSWLALLAIAAALAILGALRFTFQDIHQGA